MFMMRVENVLGPEWQKNAKGATLCKLVAQFEEELTKSQSIEEWSREVNSVSQQMSVNERIYQVSSQESGRMEIRVNINDVIIQLFKEIRSLNQAKIKMTAFLNFTADDAKTIYPQAVVLQEAMHTFYQQEHKMQDGLQRLVASHKQDVLVTIQQGANITWNCRDQLKKYVERLAQKVCLLT